MEIKMSNTVPSLTAADDFLGLMHDSTTTTGTTIKLETITVTPSKTTYHQYEKPYKFSFLILGVILLAYCIYKAIRS